MIVRTILVTILFMPLKYAAKSLLKGCFEPVSWKKNKCNKIIKIIIKDTEYSAVKRNNSKWHY